MAPHRSLPDVREIQRQMGAGLTQQEIADTYGVTRAAVSAALSRQGLASFRPRHSSLLPWRVRAVHNKHYAARMLRLEARKRDGDPITPTEERRLESWKQMLKDNNAVVHYDPRGGFFYTEPRPGVDKDLIRVPS